MLAPLEQQEEASALDEASLAVCHQHVGLTLARQQDLATAVPGLDGTAATVALRVALASGTWARA